MTGPEAPPRRGALGTGERWRELDVLRFVAALAVVAYHYTARSSDAWGVLPVERFPELSLATRYGYLGVDLFFVISGFVILLSAWGRRPGDFVVARFVRLLPAYWFCVLLTVLTLVILPVGGKQFTVGQVLANLTMLQEGVGAEHVDGAYWSLWVELRFYALMCVFAAVGITYRRCLVVMTAWTFASVVAIEADSELLRTLLVATWSPYFVAGMALCLIARFGGSVLLWGFVGLSAALAVHAGAARAAGIEARVVKADVDPLVVTAVLLAVFTVMGLVATRRLAWLRWRGLTAVGALTYPLYLLHEYVGWTLIQRLRTVLPAPAVLLAVTAGMCLLAHLVHVAVERPAARRMRRSLVAALEDVRAASEPLTMPGARRPARLPPTRSAPDEGPVPAVVGLDPDRRS